MAKPSKRQSVLSRRQQERIKASRYDANKDPLQLLEEVEDSNELHIFAFNWNWDDFRTAALLRSIIRSPLCDRGTALMIYWLTDGVFCTYANRIEIPQWAVEIYDLALEIENLMVSGSFNHQNIAFDPKDKKQLGGDYRLVLRHAKREIPSIMLEATPGQPLMESF